MKKYMLTLIGPEDIFYLLCDPEVEQEIKDADDPDDYANAQLGDPHHVEFESMVDVVSYVHDNNVDITGTYTTQFY